MGQVIAFTGHRPEKLAGKGVAISYAIERFLLAQHPSPSLILSGMAQGVDQWAAILALDHNIPWMACIPFLGQESRWSVNSQIDYRRLLEKAISVIYVSPPGYSPAKMDARNRFMVDGCDLLCSVWDGSDSGTGNCTKYAISVRKPIHRIDPRSL